jgi:F-type H+-transporting ATPase subunit delta
MNNGRAVIARSARALLDVAERDGDPDRVAAELDAVASAISGDRSISGVLFSAGVPAARKHQVIDALSARAGLSPIASRLLGVLVDRRQLPTLPQLAALFRERLLERRNIVPAEVTTAVALPADRAGALARSLGDATGKTVVVTTRVDPSIIGGVVAVVGSTVYDGSVNGQLTRMRQKLVENV